MVITSSLSSARLTCAIVIGNGSESKINRLKYTHAWLYCIPKSHFACTADGVTREEESLARSYHVQLVFCRCSTLLNSIGISYRLTLVHIVKSIVWIVGT